jgi:hypothetical protein
MENIQFIIKDYSTKILMSSIQCLELGHLQK